MRFENGDLMLCFYVGLLKIFTSRLEKIVWLAAILLVALFPPYACFADNVPRPQTAEEILVDGLLERRLFPLAILACEERLRRENLSPLEHVEAVVDLSRVFAAWARQSSPSRQSQHWKQAEAVLQRWTDRHPTSPWEPLVARQAVRLALIRGTLSQQSSQATLQPEPERKQALSQLRNCVNLANESLDHINRELRGASIKQDGKDHLTEEVLLHLQRDLQQSIARAWAEQALCFDVGSPDYMRALQEADSLFKRLADHDNPIDWESRVGHLACLRIVGTQKEFDSTAERFLQSKPPADMTGRIHSELAKQLANDQQYTDALTMLNHPLDAGKEVEAELDFVELQILLAAAAHASTSEAAEWNRRAVHQLEVIESLHDPYWTQRARTVLGGSVASGKDAQESSLLARAAEGLYQAGRTEEAIAAYELAAERAAADKNAALAFDLFRSAAAIEQEQKNYVKASQKFLQLAESYQAEPDAAKVHLLGIFNLAQSLRGSAAGDTQAYRDKLEQHLKDFSKDTFTSNQVRLWLGRLDASEGKWEAAADNFFAIDDDSPAYPGAIAAAVPYCRAQCRAALSLYFSGKDTSAEFTAKVTPVVKQIAAAAKTLLNNNDPIAPSIAAQVAQLQMRYLGDQYESALDLIKRGLEFTGSLDAKDRQTLAKLQIQALAGTGQTDEAENKIETFSGDWIGLIFGLDQVNSGVRLLSSDRRHSRRKLAALKVVAFHKLQQSSQQIDSKDRLALGLMEANALDLLGKNLEALTILRGLASDYPKDAPVQQRYADLLLQQPDKENLQIALKKYGALVRYSPPQSKRWFLAKYGQAATRLKLGQAAKAAQNVRMLQVLHPELGGTDLRQRFEELLATCIQQEALPDQ